MIYSRYDSQGNPFGVFCSNSECPFNQHHPDAHPVWTDDCPDPNGYLICPRCGSPMKMPEEIEHSHGEDIADTDS